MRCLPEVLSGLFVLSLCSIAGAQAADDVGGPTPREADRVRITAHLRTVEAELRSEDVSHLSAAQRAERGAMLDRLHVYREAAQFPRNSYVKGRTPVFIDGEGTACAMGDLLIHSGAGDLARTIAAEENLARVTAIQSVDLEPWLDEHGMTVAEAQRVQPSYSCDWDCMGMDADPVCGSDGMVYDTACAAEMCGAGPATACNTDPCSCGSDAGPGGPTSSPTDDDGCSAAGGGSPAGLALGLLLLVGRRRRRLCR